MSQQGGNFWGGFLLGSVVGGAVGGVIGALAASRLSPAEASKPEGSKEVKSVKKRPLKTVPADQSMEVARRGLEDKIAQLNDAIDDVRQQLGSVNGTVKEPERDRTIVPEP
ncbi:MAG: hypothetical protein MUF72_05225 [Elainella sp. Prado103]|jgi:TolA-binding protein|nr:hypothetical protein [Elainella sp. Prado103]